MSSLSDETEDKKFYLESRIVNAREDKRTKGLAPMDCYIRKKKKERKKIAHVN